MSKKDNTKFMINNSLTEEIQAGSIYRKCGYHIYSYDYASTMRKHQDISEISKDDILKTDISSTITIKIAFHFLSQRNTFNKNRVLARTHDIILSLNDDFNNYTTNQNTMNNFRYKSIINRVFSDNNQKQSIYLAQDYLDILPVQSANIIFQLGEVYYYPVKNQSSLAQYTDTTDTELELQTIKKYIYQNRADAIEPDKFLNIWVIDITDTTVLGFSSFPWDNRDSFDGIIVNRRCFFPEDYGESNFNLFKTFTHQMGHYFGILHVLNTNTTQGAFAAANINSDNQDNNTYVTDTPVQFAPIYDPSDKINNAKLHTDMAYNPLFMNFMDYTYDRYVTMFTKNQIQKMRYMISKYRPNINYSVHNSELPIPKYNPETDTIIKNIDTSNNVVQLDQNKPSPIPALSSTPNIQSQNPSNISNTENIRRYNPNMAFNMTNTQPYNPNMASKNMYPNGTHSVNPSIGATKLPNTASQMMEKMMHPSSARQINTKASAILPQTNTISQNKQTGQSRTLTNNLVSTLGQNTTPNTAIKFTRYGQPIQDSHVTKKIQNRQDVSKPRRIFTRTRPVDVN